MAVSGRAAWMKLGRAPFLVFGVEGELAHHQRLAFEIGQGPVHLAVLIGKDAHLGHLSGEPVGIGFHVFCMNAEQDHHPGSAGPDHFFFHAHLGAAHPLDHSPHAGKLGTGAQALSSRGLE